MQVTGQLAAEIKDVYEAFFKSLLHADLKAYTFFLEPDFRLIGTTEDEIFFSRDEALGFLEKTGEQLAGNLERRNSKLFVELIDAMILITDQFDAYVRVEGEWIFYGKTRVSSWMRQKPEGWKIIQQHFSFPDAKAAEGETVGLEKISQENLQLREAVKRRTTELEQKNRELAIEAALDRVRVVAISMTKKENLLDISKSLFNELKGLGFISIRNVMINAFNDEMGFFTDYDYSDYNNGVITKIAYEVHPIVKLYLSEIKKTNDSFSEMSIAGEDLESWKLNRRERGEPDDIRLDTISVLYYYMYSTGSAAIGLSSYSLISEENKELLKRFRNVFDFTYKRFTDVSTAFAQAREAQIEAALEKVRSSSLAIHRSDELKEVVTVLFEKLKELHVPVTAAGINIFMDGSKDLNIYVCGQNDDGLVISNYLLPYFDHCICNDFHAVREKQLDFFVGNYSWEEKNNFYEHVIANTSLKDLPGDIKEMIFQSPGYTISMATVQHSMIVINDFEGKALSKNDTDIIKRFAKVFEQAYIRFLDLQKAEAQAREAQIEVALEKIRSRSLAMQHSGELEQLVTCLFDQLVALGLTFDGALIFLLDKEKRNMQLWLATVQLSAPVRIELPYDREIENNSIIQDLWLTTETSGRYLTKTYSGQVKDDYFRYVQKYNGEKIPEAVKQIQIERDAWTFSFAAEKNSILGFDSWSGHRSADEDLQILLRFAKVFDQAYTRFLDLQKAESQAREAKIETALEKIRSRSLGMHSSVEIKFVVAILFEKLKELNLEFDGGAAIHLFTEGTQNAVIWVASPDLSEPSCVNLPFDENAFTNNPIITDIWRAKETGEHIYNKFYSFDEKNTYFNYVFKYNDFKTIPEHSRAFILQADSYTASFIAEKSSLLGANSWTRQQFSHDDFEVLKRIARVFEQAYVRFLDLQKAEAQARESQIQLALERVRARTMAMHNSNELAEVATLLFEQVKQLGIETYTSGFNIWDTEHKNLISWMSNPRGVLNPPFEMPIHTYDQHKRIYESWKNMETFMEDDLSGEALGKHYRFLRSFPLLDEAFSNAEKAGIKTPDRQVHNNAHFSNGYLLFITLQSYPKAHDIFKRFAKVFDQTYTRFLDLHKAEAQARESQIQLAMERVRARTMAMQKSDELTEAASLMFQQVQSFGVSAYTCGFNIWQVDDISVTSFMVNPDGTIAAPLRLPHTEHPYFMRSYEARKRGEGFFVMEDGGKELENTYRYMFSIPEWKEQFGKNMEDGFPVPTIQISHYVFFSQGYLLFITFEPLPEMWDIFKRFGKVFEQTYTRFLDLQKAEEQARESQIQLAMERVRARTMAMQRSDELEGAAIVLFEQMKGLGLHTGSCGFNIWDRKRKTAMVWMSSAEGGLQVPFTLPHTESEIYQQVYEAMQKGEDFLVKEVGGENLIKHFDYLLTLPGIGEVIKKGRETGYLFPETIVYHFAFFAQGYLSFHLHEHSTESHDIFKRFAKVFEQTYTRFLDLQKAEKQAREAQIELGLERVRARAMAMQQSDELAELVHTVFKELTRLHFFLDRCIIMIYDPGTNGSTWWMSNSEEAALPIGSFVKYHEHTPYLEYLTAWKNRYLKWVYLLQGNNKKEWDDFLFTETELASLPEFVKLGMTSIESVFLNVSFNNFGSLTLASLEPLPEAHFDILLRFAKVFDLTYTRFNDLKKAEAQAREAQIEVAVERVRAKALAMHHSDEIAGVARIMRNELGRLKIEGLFAATIYLEQDDGTVRLWDITIAENIIENGPKSNWDLKVRLEELHPRLFIKRIWGSTEKYFVIKQDEQDFPILIEWVYQFNKEGAEEIERTIKENNIKHTWFAGVQLEHGRMSIELQVLPPNETEPILSKIGAAFDLAYKRFLDLQKAEAQAREAKVEAALERTRTQSMLMQHSHELDNVLRVFHEQVLLLDILSAFSFLWLPDEKNDRHIFWAAWEEDQQTRHLRENDSVIFKSKAINYPLDRKDPATAQCLLDWKSNVPVYSYAVPPDGVENYFAVWKELIEGVEKLNAEHFAGGLHYVEAFMKYGCFGVMVVTDLRDDEKKVLGRFAIEFERTYTRFLDLQKAEAQAREAQIEAALERVRSRTMAMQKSVELGEVSHVINEQLQQLNFKNYNAGFLLDYRNSDDFNLRRSDASGKILEETIIPFFDHPIFNHFKLAKEQGLDFYTVELTFEEKNNWVDHALTHFKEAPLEVKEFLYSRPGYATSYVLLKNVALFIENFDGIPFSKEENNILMRFGKVFEQTYTRFLDLQKAEAQALEAIKRASVDRVRAEIASMRTTIDLERITPLIWNELSTLGVPFFRCGVFIMDEEKQEVQSYLSTPEGNAIAAFRQPYTTPGEISEMVSCWHKNELYKQHWNEEKFIEFTQNLVDQHAITSGEKYLTENRPTDLYLHFVPFLQGMLYAGSTNLLTENELQLVQNLADAFSTAYARYEDFNRLEAAKEVVDKTLADLKQTQAKLVQSEKMASLGELTAGIAHEIQNPLNFVNNFSELNKELLAEMNREIEEGNFEEVKMIALDVTGNEEKISHHGRRAEAIVKGMLQHSRSGVSEKEATDINRITDEYFRLAFHGLRGKDKSFNAILETGYAEDLPKADVVPQDIGRVMLNIFNNAFYAVNERNKEGGKIENSAVVSTYEPRVLVTTKKSGNDIVITVTDNGKGIPENIIEKIFQPFFTTKPTGQGTGLGLSLAYDIITKGHGGELKVNSVPGEGTALIITLPLTK